MMTTFAIAFSMSADAFAAALGKGATLDRRRRAGALRTGLVFGTVEAITPVIGWTCGFAASGFIATIDHRIAFALPGAIGLRMIRASATRAPDRVRARRHTLPILLMTAFATSIDAFAVGVTLALLSADIVATALAIGAASFVMASLGVMLGRYAGALLGRVAEGLAGLVLIAIGTSIPTTHLGLFSDTGVRQGERIAVLVVITSVVRHPARWLPWIASPAARNDDGVEPMPVHS